MLSGDTVTLPVGSEARFAVELRDRDDAPIRGWPPGAASVAADVPGLTARLTAFSDGPVLTLAADDEGAGSLVVSALGVELALDVVVVAP